MIIHFWNSSQTKIVFDESVIDGGSYNLNYFEENYILKPTASIGGLNSPNCENRKTVIAFRATCAKNFPGYTNEKSEENPGKTFESLMKFLFLG